MNKFKFVRSLPVLLLSGIMLVTSCNNNEETPTPTPTPTPSNNKFMTCKVDGSNWASDTTSSKLAASIISGVTVVTGIASDGTGIVIRLGATTTGTYTLDQASTQHVATYLPDQSGTTPAYATNQSSTAGGTVTVTSIDATNKLISGNFSFIVFRAIDNDSKQITTGEFKNVPYTTSTPPTSSTFSAVVDGTTYTATSITASLISGKIAIAGMNGTSSMRLFITETTAPGTYSLSMFGSYTAQWSPTTSTIYSSNPGTITITSFNSTTKNIQGTFSYTGTMQGMADVNVTNGQFNVNY